MEVPSRVRAYTKWVLGVGACLALAAAVALLVPTPGSWEAALFLGLLAAGAQMSRVEPPGSPLNRPSLIFYFAALLLLPPFGFVLVVAGAHLAEYARERLAQSPFLRRPIIQLFNLSVHVIAGLFAWVIYTRLNPHPADFSTPQAFAGGISAVVLYVVTSHALVGLRLLWLHNLNWKDNSAFWLDNFTLDAVLLAVGLVAAALLRYNPWLILPGLAPLYLVGRILIIPHLRRQANTDAKTGLWNAEFFMRALDSEISRARRHDCPFTVVVADLDLLRNINNAYGHLAGDAVLVGVAAILRRLFRDYDVVARFGGEEFAILMPETLPAAAYRHIELVRQAVEQAEFEAPTTHQRVKATMSFGLAGLNGHQCSKELIHAADMAVYRAKMRGRNCTQVFDHD